MAGVELDKLHRRIRACRLCADHGHAIEGRPVFSGTAAARVMLVGQAPGATEAETRTPFTGPSGKRLFAWLARAGMYEDAFRGEHYIASITRCYPGPGKGGRGDRSATREEQKLCRAYLDAEFELVQPEIILAVGRAAIVALCGNKPLNELVGTVQQDEAGRWIVPLPHPSGASGWLNDPENKGHLERAIRHMARLFRRLGITRA